MHKHSFTKEEFIHLTKTCRSIRQILLELGIAAQGGNYQVVHKFARQHNIDLSQLKGQGWGTGIKRSLKRPIEDYLSNTFPINSFDLKKRLLREGIFQPICSSCKNTKWLSNDIPLELDHEDGNNENNNLDNLRLLCPNCHALTPTYRGKNKH